MLGRNRFSRGRHRASAILLLRSCRGRVAADAGHRLPAVGGVLPPVPGAAGRDLLAAGDRAAGLGDHPRDRSPAPRARHGRRTGRGDPVQPPAPRGRPADGSRRRLRPAGRRGARAATHHRAADRPRQPAHPGPGATPGLRAAAQDRLVQPARAVRDQARRGPDHHHAGRRHLSRQPALRTRCRCLARPVHRGQGRQLRAHRVADPCHLPARGRAPTRRTGRRRAQRHREGTDPGAPEPAAGAGGAAFPLQHAGQCAGAGGHRPAARRADAGCT